MNIRICLLLIISCFFAIFTYAEDGADAELDEVQAIPSFLQEITSPIALSGDSIFYNQAMEKKTLENFDNRFIIVHFWASWCMDCHSELVALNKLQKEFKKKALLVIVISEDFKSMSSIDEFFKKHNIEYLDIYFDKKQAIYKALMLNHLPMSYFVDFNGEVIASSVSGVPVDWEDESLKKFLDYKASQYQLLPPEYKSVRDPYVPIENIEEKPIAPKKGEKSKIFIN